MVQCCYLFVDLIKTHWNPCWRHSLLLSYVLCPLGPCLHGTLCTHSRLKTVSCSVIVLAVKLGVNGATASNIVFLEFRKSLGTRTRRRSSNRFADIMNGSQRTRRHNLNQAGKDRSRTRQVLGANISSPERKSEKRQRNKANKKLGVFVLPRQVEVARALVRFI